MKTEFGYHPRPLRLQAGPVTIEPLPDLADIVTEIEKDDDVENGWIYAPRPQTENAGGEIRTLPYSLRVFGLPKTHILEHSAADGPDHITFHLWALSFFTGMRLTATEAGFIDTTPITPGTLVDFGMTGSALKRALELVETFWVTNRATPERARLWSAAVHALLLGQNPRLLQFEKFALLYTSLDACFALVKMIQSSTAPAGHPQRIAWMCGLFGMPIPAWADPTAKGGAEVVALRNMAIHEALFNGEPLGFALVGVGENRNLTLEMSALINRFLVALIGGGFDGYVKSPTGAYQRFGLDLIRV